MAATAPLFEKRDERDDVALLDVVRALPRRVPASFPQRARAEVDAFKQRCIKLIRRAEDGSLKLRGELKSPSTYEINA